MKKITILGLIIIISCGFFIFTRDNDSAESISDKLIRFHVVANSDSDADQEVKLKIRDEILKEYGTVLSKSGSREESLKIIRDNLNDIEETAQKVLNQEGKDYGVKAVLGESVFPIKQYGTITLPSGKYTALKVVLGEGGGKNWWCVMFPPLCFIDVTRGLTSAETDAELERILNSKDTESITAFKQNTKKTEVVAKVQESSEKAQKPSNITKTKEKQDAIKPSVEFRFKSIEIFKKTLQKLANLF